ncbi:MAG: type II secretion system major pseudopilin GspG [Planctomycetes bacterium]|nr:type II secretion system major pseudopilin GspG [Planctomycetota bacterium]
MRRSQPRFDSAFTLVEIMVVVAIIGLLAAVFVVRYADQQRIANRTIARTQISELSKAVDLFMLNNRRYPGTLDELSTRPSDAKNWPSEGYIKNLPKDPWGNAFIYRKPGREGRAYEIISYGEDAVEGGTDFNKDVTSYDKE